MGSGEHSRPRPQLPAAMAVRLAFPKPYQLGQPSLEAALDVSSSAVNMCCVDFNERQCVRPRIR